MSARFSPVSAGSPLSDQVAQQLLLEISAGRLAPGARLPTESALGQQFGVSRTVVREAVSRLKSRGLLASRQGSGVFVATPAPFVPLTFDAAVADSRDAVVQLVVVRRALEAEAAALAALRADETTLQRIEAAVSALEAAVAGGSDGVDEDLHFHRCVALAAGNDYLLHTLDYLAQYLRGAIKVTRANEARRADFAAQVRTEHARLVQALRAGDASAARAAATQHMDNAITRIGQAEPSFWQQEGARLARPLVHGLRRP
jgi:GntR family transcriptional repressor for pyruvate dehydrogenase complex